MYIKINKVGFLTDYDDFSGGFEVSNKTCETFVTWQKVELVEDEEE